MTTTAQQLKELNAKKKALADQAKALKAKLDEGKGARLLARKEATETRKALREGKTNIRKFLGTIGEVLKSKDADAIDTSADQFMEMATAFASGIRGMGKAISTMEGGTVESETPNEDLEAAIAEIGMAAQEAEL